MRAKTIELMNYDCMGCGLCATGCATNAIEMHIDEQGFVRPKIFAENCVFCEKCYRLCPLNNLITDKRSVQKTYAAFSLDDDTRFNGASGGIFTELSKQVITAMGGVVIGAAYQTDFTVKHIIVEDVASLKKLRQSKYIQSDMTEVYAQVDKLDKSIPILFVGTPCQVAAFHQYMNGKPNTVIYIDFICRGVNSPGIFLKYLEELEREHNSKIIRVWFKNKEESWNRYHTRIDFENGDVYSKNRWEDPFMRGFLKYNLYMRESCHDCHFRGEERVSDITLADYWGVEFEDENVDIEKGISAVMVHSENGERLFQKIESKIYKEEKNVESVRAGNACIDISVKRGDRKDDFYERIKTESFSKIIWEIERESM